MTNQYGIKRSEEDREKAILLLRDGASVQAVARILGASNNTIRRWRDLAGIEPLSANGRPNLPGDDESPSLAVNLPEYDRPELVSDDQPVDDIIAQRKARFAARQAAARSRRWMEFKVRADGPFGLVVVGDPHLDDNGCNWPSLDRHMALLETTPALFGIGGGDYTNNWAGRLQRIYADAEVTRKDAWRLAEWFFGRQKPTGQSVWWLLLKGNHDAWSGASDPLDWMTRGAAALEDWRAQIRATAANGVSTPIDISHNHKGHSQWNPLHGPMKEAQLGGQARVLISNHLHNWGCLETEHPNIPGHVYWACRARGYKHLDSYAVTNGFGDQQYGASVVIVVDPDKEGPQQIRCIPDVEEGVEFLKFKRGERRVYRVPANQATSK